MDGTRIMGSVGVLVAALLGVAGCSDGDDSSPADTGDTATQQSDAPDEAPSATDSDATASDSAGNAPDLPWEGEACDLLTVADVEAQFGDRGAVRAGVPEGTPQRCRWEIGSLLDDGGVVVLTVYIDESLDEDARALSDAQPVEGLGDEAYFDADNAHLLFRSGDVSALLTAGFVSYDPPVDVVIPLAEQVLSHL
jgi:hypothetical protein